jgi:hypothetical protein
MVTQQDVPLQRKGTFVATNTICMGKMMLAMRLKEQKTYTISYKL